MFSIIFHHFSSCLSYFIIISHHFKGLGEATRPEHLVNVFEARQRPTAQLTPMVELRASFRIRGLPWGQEPPTEPGWETQSMHDVEWDLETRRKGVFSKEN